jgi:hypothetical protein
MLLRIMDLARELVPEASGVDGEIFHDFHSGAAPWRRSHPDPAIASYAV